MFDSYDSDDLGHPLRLTPNQKRALDAAKFCVDAMERHDFDDRFRAMYTEMALRHVVNLLGMIHFGPGPEGDDGMD